MGNRRRQIGFRVEEARLAYRVRRLRRAPSRRSEPTGQSLGRATPANNVGRQMAQHEIAMIVIEDSTALL